MKKTPEEIVESIPEEDRGHVWHLLGAALKGKGGGVHTNDGGTGRGDGDDGSGGTPPPPPPTGH